MSGRRGGAGGPFGPPLPVRAHQGAVLLPETSDNEVAETVLDNGVRVLSERIPSVRSASVGVWVKQGSAHERPDEMGASHLLEHLVFKGTRRRTSKDLALSLESLGGSLDAYTSREHTSYQARVLDEHLPVALDVLSDLVLAPLLREEDLALEREVVLEEISTVEDTPDDLVFELHSEHLWQGHPYGHSILGTRDTVSGASSDRLSALHRHRYVASNLVVAVAGNVRHAEVVDIVRDLFEQLPRGDQAVPVPAPGKGGSGLVKVARDTSQTHVVFGNVTVPHADRRRYPLVLLAAAFGGGMSSRLFQRIREELALAYTVYSFQSFHASGGFSGVYVGTRPGWEDKVVDAVSEEHRKLAAEGLPTEELEHTRQQVKGQVMLSLESTSSRLYRLAGLALCDEPYQSLDEILARIDSVTAEEVHAAAQEFFAPERQLVLMLGPEA
jgi:predicted Zn-dependent peptidase